MSGLSMWFAGVGFGISFTIALQALFRLVSLRGSGASSLPPPVVTGRDASRRVVPPVSGPGRGGTGNTDAGEAAE